MLAHWHQCDSCQGKGKGKGGALAIAPLSNYTATAEALRYMAHNQAASHIPAFPSQL